MTQQLYDKDARDKLLQGAEKLYNAVKTTLGPKGRNVIIGKGSPIVTHDGVTVASAVQLTDKFERVGADLIKESANKLNDTAGDGTTTVTVLTYQLLKKACLLIDKGQNPMILARELEQALGGVLDYLKETKKPANDIDTLAKIATLSAGGDEELGQIVADTIFKIGIDGTITVEPSQRPDTKAELVEGIILDSGYVSPAMVTDSNHMEAIYDTPHIVIIAGKIHSFMEVLPLLEKLDTTKIKQAIIIAEEFDGEAIANFILNSRNGVFRILAIQAPSFGDKQRNLLEDLSVATGATVISKETITIDSATLEHIGTAQKVICKSNKTTFIGAGGEVEKRIQELTEMIDSSTDDYDKQNLKYRKANLEGKVGVIRVGGVTDTEITERKFRVDDAVCATKLALDEGVLAGGGVTLYKTPKTLTTSGATLLYETLQEPFKQLMDNSGLIVNEKMLTNTHGYNVNTGKLVDLYEAGIVDPCGVTERAVKTAVSLSIAGMTAGALIVEDDK